MKRFFLLMLAFCMCLPMFGCQSNTEKIEAPANFYYRRNEIGYWTESGVIQSETREISGMENAVEQILSLYLRGPASEELTQVFPSSTKLVSLLINEQETTIHISDHLHQLSGLDLSIACACLAMTAMDLTGAETVRIQTDALFSDGSNVKVFDRSYLVLLDNSAELIYESDRSENQ